MEVQCLSVPNPHSYLICAGIKDVENRGFGTDYRGRLYIHSSGRYAVRGMPPLDDCPVPVIHEFNKFLGSIQEMEKTSRYIGFADAGVQVYLKNEDRQTQRAVNEYALLSDVYRQYHENPGKPYFHVNAIIGTVTVVDVQQNAKSVWAEAGYHHWILADAVLFPEPITGVRTTRTGLWKYDLPDDDVAK
jgi:hypothetical protein